MNTRSVTWIIVIVAGLLAVVALGLVIRGETPPPHADQMVTPVPTAITPSTAPAPAPGAAPAANSAPAPASGVAAAPPPAPATSLPSTDRHSPAEPLTVPPGGYTTTPSGLKYYDYKVGTGASPQQGHKAEIEFTEWLQNGKKLASTFEGPGPVMFTVGTGEVMKGWDEAVLGMKVGGKRQVVIPPDLAFGHTGRPPKIPPDSTLVCDLELVSVE